VSAPLPPARRPRNLALMILSIVAFWIVMWSIATILVLVFFANFMNLAYSDESKRLLLDWIGAPMMLFFLALSIWLAVIGKLPGTRK
jgi:hypothetical protein